MTATEIEKLRVELSLKEMALDLLMAIDHIRDTVSEPLEMLSAIVDLLAERLDSEVSLLALIDPETNEIDLKAINHRDEQQKAMAALVTSSLLEQAVELDDVTIWTAPDLLGSDAPPGVQLAAVPIVMGQDRRLGALLLGRTNHPFSQADIDLLQIAEDHIDSAVIQGYAHYELEQHVKELETIYRIDHIRDLNLPFDDMLDAVLQALCQTIEADQGFVLLYDNTGRQLEMRAATCDDLLQSTVTQEVINQLSAEALQEGRLLCRHNLPHDLASVMCLPLILNGQIIGVVGVANSDKSPLFRREHRRLLSAIGSQMDTAIFESLERRQLRQVLGRSVDPQILERLLASNTVAVLKGERAVITVLYADIRGSTALAEKTDPELLVGFINHYLGQMTDTTLAHHGTLDKFVGDEVMALFGAPFPQPDHALRAIRVGLEMQKAHESVIAMWQERGVDAQPIGIGIATGELIMGEMGSPQRTQYTVIGQAANLGARICSSAQGGQVLICQATYDLVKDQVDAKPVRGMEYKGVSGLVTVYEVERINQR